MSFFIYLFKNYTALLIILIISFGVSTFNAITNKDYLWWLCAFVFLINLFCLVVEAYKNYHRVEVDD